MKHKKVMVYFSLIGLSIFLCIISMMILKDTKFTALICITIGIYLLARSLIKLCKMSEKLKHTVLCAIDLLFWLS